MFLNVGRPWRIFGGRPHHELIHGGLHGTPDISLIATKYSVAIVVDTFQRRSRERKREDRAEEKALLQLFSPTASIALSDEGAARTLDSDQDRNPAAITVSPYPYDVSCVWS